MLIIIINMNSPHFEYTSLRKILFPKILEMTVCCESCMIKMNNRFQFRLTKISIIYSG